MKHILFLFFFSFTMAAFGKPLDVEKPTYVGTIEGIKEYSLSNGLQILFIPDQSQNNMIVNIVYKVGSRHEGYGEKGMAHLLEHMLFKDTKNMGDIKKQLTEKGGNANGTTWYDRTNYYEIFPSSDENLEWSLMMEADRMIYATISQDALDKEFSVVRNEFEIGENDPGGVLMERILSTSYLWHNYGQSTIGSKEDIERVKAERLKRFYKKYYQPNNATLIVAGNFNEDKALEYIEKYFSPIPAKEIQDKTYTVEPAQDGERFVELKRSGDVYILGAAYHTVPYAHKDYAALDALSEILTSEPSGYLYKALIDSQKATSIWSWQPSLRDAAFMYFNLEVPKDKNFDEAKMSFLTELNSIGTKSYTQKDLDRAKAKLTKQIENFKNNTIGMAVGFTEFIGAGDYKLAFLYRDAVENLTLEDVQRVAEYYFKENNRTLGTFIPTDNEKRVAPKEISDAELLTLTKDYKGKEIEVEDLSFEPTILNVKNNLTEQTLPNGMRYVFLNKPIKGKKVQARFIAPTGTLKELEGKAIVADLMSSMLKMGTKSKSREEIQDLLDQMKSTVRFGWGGQKLFININTYQEYLPQVMELVKEMLTESTFPAQELEKLKLENITDLEFRLKDPQSIAFSKISQYKQPYKNGHIFYEYTTEELIDANKNVTPNQIVDFYNKFLGGNNAFGTIVGKMDASAVNQLMEKTFGDWKAKAKYKKITPESYSFAAETEKLITPDKENAVAAGFLRYELDRANSDYPAMLMANEILGGGFITSRIPNRLREKEGISYGAGSFTSVPISHKSANFGVYAFFNPNKVNEVETGLKEEVQKASNSTFTEKELNDARTSWNNSRKTWFTNDSQLISLINDQLEFGVDIQVFDDLAEKVENLTVSDVNAAAQKYIRPENMYLVLVGDFK